MLNKYGERTQPCRTPFLRRNHSDSVPATVTLASCFLYSLSSKSIKCIGYPMSIIVTQSLSWGDRVERLLEVHKAHVAWLLVLACLVHQYSEFRDLFSCPPSVSESCLFICNSVSVFTRILSSMIRRRILLAWETSNCSVICTLLKIAFLGKWDEHGERPFLWPLTSFPDRLTYSVHSFQYRLSSCFEQFCWDLIRTCGFATCCLTDGTSNLLFSSFSFLITVQVFTIPFPPVCDLCSFSQIFASC